MVEALPLSMVQGIDISVFETILIYTVIISFFVLLMDREFGLIHLTLSAVAIFLGFQIYESIDQQNQEKLIVYNVRKGFAMDVISGTDHFFSANDKLLDDKNSMLFHVEHNWWALGLQTRTTDTIASHNAGRLGSLFKYKGENIWLSPVNIDSIPIVQIDRLVIGASSNNDWNAILDSTKPRQVLVGQNITYHELKEIRAACKATQIDLRECKVSGPLIL